MHSGVSWMGGFNERGPIPVALRHHSGKTARTSLGVNLDARWQLKLGRLPVNFATGAAYLGEIYEEGASSNISMITPNAPKFTVRAQRPDPSFLQVRSSLTAELSRNGYAYFSVESSHLSYGHQGYNLSSGVFFRW